MVPADGIIGSQFGYTYSQSGMHCFSQTSVYKKQTNIAMATVTLTGVKGRQIQGTIP